jgi:hypothetical protein
VATEPKKTRAVAFVDGQNLYHAAREAFGYTYPNYDPAKLAEDVCKQQGWILGETRFYTGMPDAKRDPGREAGARFSAGIVLYDGETSLSFGGGLHAVPIRSLWEI